jgi:hypothetical protein
VRDTSFLTSLSSGEAELWSQADNGAIAWITGESLRDAWVSAADRRSAKWLPDLAPADDLDLGKELTITWHITKHSAVRFFFRQTTDRASAIRLSSTSTPFPAQRDG